MARSKFESKMLRRAVCLAVIGGSMMYMAPSAMAAEVYEVKNGVGAFSGTKWQDETGYVGYGNIQQNKDVVIENSTFSNNENKSAAGPNASVLYTYDSTRQVSATINDSTFTGNKVNTLSESKTIGYGAMAGAIAFKGTKAIITDSQFTNNVVRTETGNAYAAGGALYLDATMKDENVFNTEAVIKVTGGNLKYSGNNVENADDKWFNSYNAVVQSGGGFMFLDRNATAKFDIADGSTLTIGDEGASGDMDSISSAIPIANTKVEFAKLEKNGNGTLTLNGSLNKYYGTINVNSGSMNVNSDWVATNEINVNNGALVVKSLTLGKGVTDVTAYDSKGNETAYELKVHNGSLNVEGGTVDITNALTVNEGTSANVSGGVLTAGSYAGAGDIKVSSKGTLVGTKALFNEAGDEKTFKGLNVEDGNLVLTDEGSFTNDYLTNLKTLTKASTITLSKGTIADAPTDAAGNVEIDKLNGVGANLANVSATTDGKNLVIGESTTAGDGNVAVGSLGVKSIDLGTATNVTIGNGGALTLTGDGSGEVLKSTGGEVNVDLAGEGTTLNLGTVGAATSGGEIKGAVSVGEGATANVANGEFKIQEVTLDKGTVNVGSSAAAADLKVKKLTIKESSTLFIDPDWGTGTNNITGASKVAAAETGTINGNIYVGRNSIMSAGSEDATWATDAFNKNSAGWTWGQGQTGAALAVKTQQTLGSTGSLTVDGTLTAAPASATANKATFAADSVFIIDSAALAGAAALKGTDATLDVANGAKLLVANAKDGATVTPTEGFTTGDLETWNVASDDRMLVAAYDASTAAKGDIKVAMTTTSPLKGTLADGMLNGLYTSGANDVNSSNPGIAFLSQVASSSYVASDAEAKAIANTVTGLTAAGGQQSATLNGTKLFTGAVQNHMTDKPSDGHIWAQYIHSNSKMRDLSLGNSDYGFDNKFNGAVVGGDFIATDSKHAGLAFAYGEGKVSGNATNNYKTWGLDLYHAWHNDKAVVMADLGYLKNDGEIKTGNTLGKFSSDPTSNAWTLGVRGELKTAGAFTPYAGLRYVRLTTDSSNINNAAGTVFNVGKDTQNLWLLPVGVGYSKRIAKGNGVLVPKADIGVLFAFGDKDTSASVNIPGQSASSNMGVQITDTTSLIGSLGLTYETKKFNYGVAYQLQAGSKETRNGLWANVEYKF